MGPVQVLISGRVQKVGFRYWAAQTAKKLGLTGWVKNRPDGQVEILFHGEPANMALMLEFIKKGPALSRVDGLEFVDPPKDLSYNDFLIKT